MIHLLLDIFQLIQQMHADAVDLKSSLVVLAMKTELDLNLMRLFHD